MNIQNIFCFLTALAVSSLGTISSQKIYLSPAGNDTNPGTVDKPLATLTAAPR